MAGRRLWDFLHTLLCSTPSGPTFWHCKHHCRLKNTALLPLLCRSQRARLHVSRRTSASRQGCSLCTFSPANSMDTDVHASLATRLQSCQSCENRTSLCNIHGTIQRATPVCWSAWVWKQSLYAADIYNIPLACTGQNYMSRSKPSPAQKH